MISRILTFRDFNKESIGCKELRIKKIYAYVAGRASRA
jgi:hypothetical protein